MTFYNSPDDEREIKYQNDCLTTNLAKGAKISSGHVLKKVNNSDKKLPHPGKEILPAKSRGNTQNINIKLWKIILK